jgi:hypothetical protein
VVPLLLLVGVISGAAFHVRPALLVGTLGALAWGVIVGVVDANVSTAIAGAGLAAVNALVGISVGLLVRRGLRGRSSTQPGLRAP